MRMRNRAQVLGRSDGSAFVCLLFFQNTARKRMSIASGEITHTLHQQHLICWGQSTGFTLVCRRCCHWCAQEICKLTDIFPRLHYLPCIIIQRAVSFAQALKYFCFWPSLLTESHPIHCNFLHLCCTSVGQMEEVALKHIRYLMKIR